MRFHIHVVFNVYGYGKPLWNLIDKLIIQLVKSSMIIQFESTLVELVSSLINLNK